MDLPLAMRGHMSLHSIAAAACRQVEIKSTAQRYGGSDTPRLGSMVI